MKSFTNSLVGRKSRMITDLRERWERGGASVHSYRSLQKLCKITNYFMSYILDSSDAGVPCGSVSWQVSGWAMSWCMTPGWGLAWHAPLGVSAACWPLGVSRLPGGEMSVGFHILDPMTRCPPEWVQGGVMSLRRSWHLSPREVSSWSVMLTLEVAGTLGLDRIRDVCRVVLGFGLPLTLAGPSLCWCRIAWGGFISSRFGVHFLIIFYLYR